MTAFEVAAVLLTLTALFGFVNERFIKLPTTIGVTLIALCLSLGLVIFASPGIEAWAEHFLEGLHFDQLVLEGMLSFLLFAGSLTVNLDDLNRQKWSVLILATVGVLISTFVVGILSFFVLKLLGLELPFIYALLFGALISPTDPIAVLSILKRVGVPKDIETLITGESLFNDGVGVVIFSVILSMAGVAAHGEHGESSVNIPLLFLQEAVGGIIFGLIIGLIAYFLLKAIDNYTVEIVITLALVVGGYALAMSLHTSGPLAMVIAGLFIGNRGRLFAMSARTREHLDTFWELVDEILNALLFVLIGLEMIIVGLRMNHVIGALIMIPIVLLGRFASVGIPISLLRLRQSFLPYTVRMMVWGGLRGGISVALALSLPAGEERDLIIGLTYGVVVFAILIQGLSIGQIAKRIPKAA
ncbi:MAG: sodium:proton antiporter [Trueperaceae bacterium]|nr:sodium:proton antiporter [Trueperaceae bacterium]